MCEDMVTKKDTNNSPPLYVLPSDNKELQIFSQKFKIDMMEQVAKTIEYAIEHDMEVVEVFQFKNSDFVITLSSKDYLNNIDNIYSYYMKNEVYEKCQRVVALQNVLKQKFVQKSYEQKT